MDPHYVHAEESLDDENSRVLKHGDTFAIFDHYGNINRGGLGEQGLYHEGTRFLSCFALYLSNLRPLLLSSTIKQDNALLAVDLTNPDMREGDQLVLPRGTLHIFRSLFLWNGTLYEESRFKNYSDRSFELPFTLRFHSDFADIFEVRGMKRSRRGEFLGQTLKDGELSLAYRGLDGVDRKTVFRLPNEPEAIEPGKLSFHVAMGPREEKTTILSVRCEAGPDPIHSLPHSSAYLLTKNSFAERKKNTAMILTSHPQCNEWIGRSHADLHMMLSTTPYGEYPYAGVPWFSTPFGRDGIITALECLWFFPEMAKGVLSFLAATQAQDTISESDAQPGKILHETRRGEMAALGEIPFGQYYGSVDATPLFVLLAGAYYDRTGDYRFIEKIWPNIEAALNWIDTCGDVDGDGFVEYSRRSSKGLVHQGWKDSEDSIFLQDGTLAEGPIALCEVQGYVYSAKIYASKLAKMVGKPAFAKQLAESAEALRVKFEETFWCEELSTYAIALDGAKRRCQVRSSNPGHCLFTGIVSQERAEKVAASLLSDDLFSGWGIRTISSSEKRYNPMSYHNGSVWPHDNAIIAHGFSKYRLKHGVLRVLDGLFNASLFVNLHRMPELFCGFSRRPGEGPTLYPVACSPQAWSAGSVFLLLEAALGLHIEASPRKKIWLFHPELPAFLNELRILQLTVGDASVDLLLRRHREDIGVNVLSRRGDVEIIVVK